MVFLDYEPDVPAAKELKTGIGYKVTVIPG